MLGHFLLTLIPRPELDLSHGFALSNIHHTILRRICKHALDIADNDYGRSEVLLSESDRLPLFSIRVTSQ